MLNIKTINNISDKGLSRLPAEIYSVDPDIENPDAIILRSQNLHDMEVPTNLKVVGRAGAGTNNVSADLKAEGLSLFTSPALKNATSNPADPVDWMRTLLASLGEHDVFPTNVSL